MNHRKGSEPPSKSVSQTHKSSVDRRLNSSSRPTVNKKDAQGQKIISLNNKALGRSASKRSYYKIGVPNYDVVKLRHPDTQQLGIRIELQFNKIKPGTEPAFRIMSPYEQTVEEVNTKFQYLVVAAEPYESIALRIPSIPVDEDSILSNYNKSRKSMRIQLLFT